LAHRKAKPPAPVMLQHQPLRSGPRWRDARYRSGPRFGSTSKVFKNYSL